MVSGLGFDVVFWFFDLRFLFLCYCAWFKGFGLRLWCIILVFGPEASFCLLLRLVLGGRVRFRCIFFGFSTWCFFLYVTAVGLRVSGLASDAFFWFFDMRLVFLCYWATFKGGRFRLPYIFFCFSPWGCFFYVTALGLRVSGLVSDVFFRCLRWGFPFYATAIGIRVLGLGSAVLFWFFDLRLFFVCFFCWF